MRGPLQKVRICGLLAVFIFGMVTIPVAHASNTIGGQVVLKLGGPGAWDGYQVFRPFAIYNNSTYMMWYSGESVFNTDGIGFANSTDGVSWKRYSRNPVLQVGAGIGVWDEGKVKDPWVLRENGTYKMWYTGLLFMQYQKVVIVAEQIGYATSPDGKNWTKYAGNPVVAYGPTGSLNDKWVYRPVVLHTKSSYVMYYSFLSQTGTYGVGMATSKDGISWTKLGPITMPNSGWNAYTSSPGSIIPVNDTMLMAYTGQSAQGAPPQIGFANSTNGMNWATYSLNPLISGGGATSWDNAGVSDPMVVKVGDHYNVYFTGQASNGTIQIGLATLPTSQVSIPEFPPGDVLLVALTLFIFSSFYRRREPGTPRLSGNQVIGVA
jgi:predicted GH43/DUF377 family glycosyl hydrolase